MSVEIPLPAEIVQIIAGETKNHLAQMFIRKTCKLWRDAIKLQPIERNDVLLRGVLIDYIAESKDLCMMVDYLESSEMIHMICKLAWSDVKQIIINIIAYRWTCNTTYVRVKSVVDLVKSHPYYIDSFLSDGYTMKNLINAGFAEIYAYGKYQEEQSAICVLGRLLMICYDTELLKRAFYQHIRAYTCIRDIPKLVTHCLINNQHYSSDRMVLLMKIIIDHCGYHGNSSGNWYYY